MGVKVEQARNHCDVHCVHFSQPKIISKVVIRKHHQKPRNKYANVCFILKDQTQEIGRKCTVGTRGEPFFLERPNEIKIIFSNIPNVHTVHIKFEETNLYKGTHAQIAELQIEGYFPSTGPKNSGTATTKQTKPMTTTSTTTITTTITSTTTTSTTTMTTTTTTTTKSITTTTTTTTSTTTTTFTATTETTYKTTFEAKGHNALLESTGLLVHEHDKQQNNLSNECKDSSITCYGWKVAGYCNSRVGWMLQNCPSMCNKCQQYNNGSANTYIISFVILFISLLIQS